MNRESSLMVVMVTAVGSDCLIFSSLARTPSMTATVFSHGPAHVDHHRRGVAEPHGARRALRGVFRVADV